MKPTSRLSSLVAAIERLELEPIGSEVLGRGIEHHGFAARPKAVETNTDRK